MIRLSRCIAGNSCFLIVSWQDDSREWKLRMKRELACLIKFLYGILMIILHTKFIWCSFNWWQLTLLQGLICLLYTELVFCRFFLYSSAFLWWIKQILVYNFKEYYTKYIMKSNYLYIFSVNVLLITHFEKIKKV